MAMELHKLDNDSLFWFVETAAVNMLNEELKRPELVDLPSLYMLAVKGMHDGTAWVVTKDDEYVGAVGGLLIPNMFNHKLTTLAEVFWYVLPEYRNSRAGLLLLKAMEDCFEERADELVMSLLPSSTVTVGGLEKRGYIHSENVLRKRK